MFSDVLGYHVEELRRGCDEFIAHGESSQFHVFALNLPKNQLTQLNEDSIDQLFRRLRQEFRIKPEDCPVFYLYDRDVLSYRRNELRGKYVMKYTDPYSNDSGDQGQLLLSYPAVESFLLSCVMNQSYTHTARPGKDAKSILLQAVRTENETLSRQTVDLVFPPDTDEAETRLVHAVSEMNAALESLGMKSYDLDHLGPVLLNVYDQQQIKYSSENTFSLISLVAMAFLELGIIEETDEGNPE